MDSADHCPTEDAIRILLEQLVDPALPSKSSARIMPSESAQELVAKQVHAVVLLYNYFYRKQHPHLEFLDFENFCKLAIIQRPNLLAHMKYMQLSDDFKLDDPQEQLSLTEKKIMNACDTAASLDASEAVPGTARWPIRKVSVFLIDFTMEKCSLKNGSVTQGVWSVIEKDVDLTNNNLKGSMDSELVNKKKKYIRKPLKYESSADEGRLLQLAYSVVEETTGINQSDLLVLEKHDVYSIREEKAAACFYIMQIMQCIQPKSDDLSQIPIKDVIESLQGPMFVRSSNEWEHTPVVEHFHLLPYVEILSNWASKEGISDSLQVQSIGPQNINVNTSKRIKTHCVTEVSGSSRQQHLGSSKETASMKQNETNECHVIDSPHNVDGTRDMEVDDSSLIHAKIKEDIGITVNCSKLSSKDGCLNGPVNKDEMVDHLKGQRITGNESNASGSCNSISSDKDWMPASDHALVQHHASSNDLDKLLTIIASKDQQLSEAAVKVILSKRAKLSLQLRDIEDQIVQCDQNIQTILNGGEGNLAVKIEAIIEACNDVPLRSLIQEKTTYQPSTPSIQTKTCPANLQNQNPIEELDELCCRNNWILPTYSSTSQDGGFQASVTVKAMDFEYSSNGDLCAHPHEARASAATKMLAKLCNAIPSE